MTDADQKIELIAAAAEDLLALVSRGQKELLEGLAGRPRKGAKARAREVCVEQLKAIRQFRSVASTLRDFKLVGSSETAPFGADS